MSSYAPQPLTLNKRLSRWIDAVSPTQAAIGFVLLGVGVLIGGSINFLPEFWTGTSSNLGVEFLSIAITVLVIDGLNKREAKREKQSDLILQMQSKDNSIAAAAVDQLRIRGWMQADSLEEEYITGANLENVNLQWANLQRTQVSETNLQGAHLDGAQLQGAVFKNAILQNAALVCANLKGTTFNATSLHGANLKDANLEGAQFSIPRVFGWELDYSGFFDEKTVLPDGSHWTPETDLTRFTDATHAQFWRSDTTYSPAYRGETG